MPVVHGGNVEKVAALMHRPVSALSDFSANINPLGVPDELKDQLIASLDQLTHYPNPDYPKLKQAIADHFHVQEEAVFVGNGAVQMIFALALMVKAPEALVLAPTFGEYERAFARCGTKVRYFHLKEDDAFTLNISQLINDLEQHPRTKVVCVCNPNNPTGQLVSDLEVRRLCDYCAKTNRWLILDEAFMDLAVTDQQGLVPLLKPSDPALVIRSATKYFAIPGLRLGYAMTRNQPLQTGLQSQIEPWTVNTIAADFGARMFQATKYRVQTEAWLQQELPWMLEQMKDLPQVIVYPSSTNFILFKSDLSDLRERLWQQGFLIRSCYDYEGLNQHFYRVAVRLHEDNVSLLTALKKSLIN